MNKKVMYIVIAVIVIALIAAGVYFLFFNKSNTKTLDLATLNTEVSKQGRFDEMATMDIDKEILSNVYGIDQSQVEEVVGKMPMMNVQASMYVILKATSGNVEKVKEKLESYGQAYASQWEQYLPAQYELVQQRKIGVVGNYAYMIVCENAQEIENMIKK